MARTAEELKGKPARFDIIFDRYVYPKTRKYDNEWVVFKCDITKVESGELPEEFGDGEGNDVGFVGYCPILDKNAKYCVEATLELNHQYGWQYKIESIYLKFDPKSKEELFSYITAITEPRVSRGLWEAKFDVYKAIKNNDINLLQTVPFIGPKRAVKIIDKFNEQIKYAEAFLTLGKYGIPKTAVMKIVDRYWGDAHLAVSKVLKNPYILVEEVRGYGWEKADELARKLGIDPDGKERCQAYMKYFLNEQAEDNGHSWLEVDDLCKSTAVKCPNLTPTQAKEWIQEMIDNKELFYAKMDGGEGGGVPLKRIGLYSLHRTEEEIAENLMRLKYAPNYEFENLDEIIKEAEGISGYEFTGQQKEAVRLISENKVTVITAMAGSGKSSTMLPVALALKKMGKFFAQVALSGKASLNLTEITHQEGETIHRLLGYRPRRPVSRDVSGSDGDGLEKFDEEIMKALDDEEGEIINGLRNEGAKRTNFTYNATNQLDVDAVIVDEVSMIGGGLFLSLLEAIPDKAKLILIGDEGQLEAIGYCNVLYDIRKSHAIPSYRLTEILRQSAKSGIITDSALVYNKKSFIKSSFAGEERHGELQDFKIVSAEGNAQIRAFVLREFREYLSIPGVKVEDIIVAATKRSAGALSAYHLSEDIQTLVNGRPQPEEVTIPYSDTGVKGGSITFRKGDRVLVTRNQYGMRSEIDWASHEWDSVKEMPPSLFGEMLKRYTKEVIENYVPSLDKNDPRRVTVYNGNLGTVLWTLKEQKAVCVQFPQGAVVFEGRGDSSGKTLDSLQLGYAATTHKLQGSGIPYVIAIIDPSAYTLNTNEALYTQITRAKKGCTLIGNPLGINRQIATSYVKVKKTWLGEMLYDTDKAIKEGQRAPRVTPVDESEEIEKKEEKIADNKQEPAKIRKEIRVKEFKPPRYDFPIEF